MGNCIRRRNPALVAFEKFDVELGAFTPPMKMGDPLNDFSDGIIGQLNTLLKEGHPLNGWDLQRYILASIQFSVYARKTTYSEEVKFLNLLLPVLRDLNESVACRCLDISSILFRLVRTQWVKDKAISGSVAHPDELPFYLKFKGVPINLIFEELKKGKFHDWCQLGYLLPWLAGTKGFHEIFDTFFYRLNTREQLSLLREDLNFHRCFGTIDLDRIWLSSRESKKAYKQTSENLYKEFSRVIHHSSPDQILSTPSRFEKLKTKVPAILEFDVLLK